MHIRKAMPDDAAAACAVLRRSIIELCEPDHQHNPEILNRWLANKTPENVAEWICSADDHVYVAVENAEVVGVAAVSRKGIITLNYVSPDARFRGVSKMLLQQLERTAAEWGNTRCTLSSTITAHKFYLVAGFVDQGPRNSNPLAGQTMIKNLSA